MKMNNLIVVQTIVIRQKNKNKKTVKGLTPNGFIMQKYQKVAI